MPNNFFKVKLVTQILNGKIFFFNINIKTSKESKILLLLLLFMHTKFGAKQSQKNN